MVNTDLTSTMHKMMAEMGAMRAELDDLKKRANAVARTEPEPIEQPLRPAVISTTRRKALRRLAGGLLAGLSVAGVAAILPGQAEAGFARSGGAGAILLPAGGTVSYYLPGTSSYGLIATPDSNLDLRFMPSDNIGVVGYTLNPSSNSYGIYGESNAGSGVFGFSENGHGIRAGGHGQGLAGAALYALNSNGGIAAWADTNSGDATMVLTNAFAGGQLIKGFTGGGVTPVFRIDGAGKGFFNGGTQASGADLAEFIPVLEALEPGEVVEIDPNNPGHFRRCTTTGSLAVAGVISTKPGMTLGGTDPAGVDNKGSQLALAGRIPVKVTDEGGSIRPGDLLIASSTPGYAMRAPSPAIEGSVLGKALGVLNSGFGTIEILVMLR
jgi:hypothetical protein